ncbi:MAG: yciF [Verrucomicrobiales bacterium]|nr:yciF [Verrucomicrobiales bacterium]
MNSLQKLFEDQLADILYAEKQLVKVLPKMAKAAEHEHLKAAITKHLAETKVQVERLEQVFESIGKKARAKKCEAIIGILTEGSEITAEFAGVDAAVILACQKVEHYEIATYGCLVTWAKLLGHKQAATLLGQTLGEEEKTDAGLSELAETVCNQEAVEA